MGENPLNTLTIAYMAEENELQDSQTPDEEQQTEEVADAGVDVEKLTETNKRLFERAKKAEAELKEIKKSKEATAQPKQETSTLDVSQELQKIRLEAKGFSEKQIDFVMKLGGVKALENEEIKVAVEAIGEREAQTKAQAESTIQGKPEKKYTEDHLRNLSSDEIAKLVREGKIK